MEIDDIYYRPGDATKHVNEAVQQALMDNAQQLIEELHKEDLYTTEEIADKLGVSRSIQNLMISLVGTVLGGFLGGYVFANPEPINLASSTRKPRSS